MNNNLDKKKKKKKYDDFYFTSAKVLSDTIFKYEEELLNKESKIECLNSEIDNLKRQMSGLKTDISNRDSQISDLKTTISNNEKDSKKLSDISNFLSKAVEYQNEIKKLEDENAYRKTQIDTLTSKKKELETDCYKKDVRIRNLENKKQELETDIEGKKSVIDTLTAKKQELEIDIEGKKSQIDILTANEEELQIQLEEKKGHNRELDTKIKELEKENSKIGNLENNEKNLKEEIEVLKDKNSKYETDYECIYTLQKLYKGLSDEIRNSLKEIFGNGDSIIGIIVRMSQQSKINSFSSFIVNRITAQKLEQIDDLKEIFDISFGIFKENDSNFLRHNFKSGDKFDPKTMIKGPNSDQFGIVKEVLFQGYEYSVNHNVHQKSVVNAVMKN